MMTKFDPALSIALGWGVDGNRGVSISRRLSHASTLADVAVLSELGAPSVEPDRRVLAGEIIRRPVRKIASLPNALAILLAMRRSPACCAPERPCAAIGRERG